MEKEQKEGDILSLNINKNKIHLILAHSYTVYFILFLVGIFLDFIFKIKILNASFIPSLGVLFIALATILIVWAQRTSRNLKKDNLTKNNFLKGPYSITRSPTHWGLFFLMLGFGFISNAIFIVLTTIISFFISKFIYLKKEESILEKKYGEPYKEYKKIVKF